MGEPRGGWVDEVLVVGGVVSEVVEGF